MKYAIFSDIHSNYEALIVCLKKMQELKVDAHAFCGDLVGYGPNPEECTRELMKLENLTSVMGNHDVALFNKDFSRWFSEYASKAMVFTAKNITAKSKKFISKFLKEYQGAHFAMVHGSFNDPYRDYLLTPEQFIMNLPKWQGNICFVGHSHVPFIMSYREGHIPQIDVFYGRDVSIKLMPGVRYMINPGSIGQPRDTNPRASFGIFDTEKYTFRLLRLPYDIKAVQTKIEAAKLPQILSDRLPKGV
ncbi:MAG: metallophosphoesterase family protein [Elusimicrobiaceae bacterium]|nr:metallophosphoesterase family protein [Elusimicrobiaceae bacterium]MBQ6223855.1 metallophosphoesterase family protein [Campylobacter sp.]